MNPSAPPELQLPAAHRPAIPSTTERPADRLRRRLVDLMPLMLVVLLLLATLWLVRSMPDTGVTTPPPPPNEPDYYMQDFRIRNFNAQGQLDRDLTGQHGDHLPGPDSLRISQPRSLSIDPRGIEVRSKADRSVSDRKGDDIELFDNVRVERTDPRPGVDGKAPLPMVLESSYLHATDKQQHIVTDKPVRITQGGDVINGSGLEYTNASRVLQIHGRVQAQLQPRAR